MSQYPFRHFDQAHCHPKVDDGTSPDLRQVCFGGHSCSPSHETLGRSSQNAINSTAAPLGQLLPNPFRVGRLDLLIDFQRSLRAWDSLCTVAQLVQRQAHVEERVAFPAPVSNLTRNDQRLLVVLDGFTGVASNDCRSRARGTRAGSKHRVRRVRVNLDDNARLEPIQYRNTRRARQVQPPRHASDIVIEPSLVGLERRDCARHRFITDPLRRISRHVSHDNVMGWWVSLPFHTRSSFVRQVQFP